MSSSQYTSVRSERTSHQTSVHSERTSLISRCPAHLKEGDYFPTQSTDKRSPCPLLNALANHGHLPRDGKNISGDDFVAGLAKAGIASTLSAVMARPIYVKFEDPKLAYTRKPRTFFQALWYYIKNPWAIILGGYGLWDGKSIYNNKRVMDLDRLALHGVAEHDISMTRRDTAQEQGANDPQYDLIDELLELKNDEGYITLDAMTKYRRKRIETQLEDNTGLYYGPWEHQTACSNIALILHAFGDGKQVRADVLEALLKEERLPHKEGWQRRWWWPLGVLELGTAANKIKALIGMKI